MHFLPAPLYKQRKRRRRTGPTSSPYINRVYRAKMIELRRHIRTRMLPDRYQS